ncbi:MAG: SDR family NAD(P)-dependent oxidoreductase [Acidobacteriota bacterium]
MSDDEMEDGGREIAVIGMSGRFPGARDLKELWHNLRNGMEAVTFFSDGELLAAGVPAERLRDPRYVKAGSVLADVDLFDAGFFGYTAREAEIMDPQQRLFLEHAWQALEDAGYAPASYEGLIGVYAGVAWNTYLLSNLTSNRDLFEGGGGFQVFITNDKDFMPTRVSYKLNLKGPSVVVQTSCSTSLVAVHLACLSLLNYECDMALAGGVTVKVPQAEGYYHLEGGLASPDGHCRPFDARAQGTIFGSGVGMVTLKRLADALADGDTIHAVIKGSAINNDGSMKVSYTAPSVEGQAEVIASAHAIAGIDAESVRYIETHGTGTSLGDPVEVTALTKVFRDSTERRGFCALGSIKSNLGHLDAAAGIAGFLKTVLALEHRQIPPSLNFEEPNPAIDFASSPFYVNSRLAEWEAEEGPRRAGVSSFGVGGTNAHVVLEEAPPAEPAAASRPWQLLLLSARSEEALVAATDNLLACLREEEAAGLPDVAFTLQVGRTVFRHRRALVCRDRAEAVALLESRDPGRLPTAADLDDPRERPVVFLFPGDGARVDLGRGLYESEAVFREEVDRCAELLRPGLGLDLRSRLYPAGGEAGGLDSPALAAAALFVVEHALARLWMSWGVRPQALAGQGVGELVAACLAGTLTLESALGQALARGPESGGWEEELSADPRRLLLRVGPGRAAEPGVLSSLGDSDPDPAALLAALGGLWLAGLKIDWSGFHAGERRRRVALPTYPFERQRFWIGPAASAPAPTSSAAKKPDIADWFYLPAWKPALPPEPRDGEPPWRWLILAGPGGPAAGLAERLDRDGREVVVVETPPQDDEAWVELLAEVRPDAVVHAWCLDRDEPAADSVEMFEAARERDFGSLLGLVRALGRKGAARVDLTVAASGMFALTPEEPLRPESAALAGLCKVLPQELPGVACRAVDLSTGGARALDGLAGELLARSSEERVAYRGGRRWLPAWEPVRLEEPGPLVPFRDRGVYLLTGGLQGNGHALARYLASAARARLVLVEDLAADPEVAGPRVRDLEALGAEVLLLAADLADAGSLRDAVGQAEARFGALHGAIHAAGTAGERTFRLLRELDREACGWHFRPKVHALFALEAALAGHGLDFVAVVSSLATVLGGVAYAAYTAANLAEDAFVHEHNRRAGPGETPWLSLGWDVWQLEAEEEQITAVRDDLAGLAMTPREGEEAFRRAVAAPGLGAVLVSTADLAARISTAGRRIGALQERAAPATLHPRPQIQTAFAAPETDLERRIAEVWKRTLGFEQIGAHDNFFELGGDSFLAVQVVSRLQEELEVELPVARLYQGLTVRSLAALLALDEAAAAERRSEQLEERRESMGRRREFLERRRSNRKSEAR